jgi:DNA-binding NtrC family response regulator
MKALDASRIDVVILDVKMPGVDGLEVLGWIKKKHPLVEVIMLTGHATFESAIEGMKLGAFDYLMKPSDIQMLLDKANEAFAKKQAREEKIQKARIERIISNPLAALDDELPEEE